MSSHPSATTWLEFRLQQQSHAAQVWGFYGDWLDDFGVDFDGDDLAELGADDCRDSRGMRVARMPKAYAAMVVGWWMAAIGPLSERYSTGSVECWGCTIADELAAMREAAQSEETGWELWGVDTGDHGHEMISCESAKVISLATQHIAATLDSKQQTAGDWNSFWNATAEALWEAPETIGKWTAKFIVGAARVTGKAGGSFLWGFVQEIGPLPWIVLGAYYLRKQG